MVWTPQTQGVMPAARLTTGGLRSMAAGGSWRVKDIDKWKYRYIYMFKVWLRRRLRQVFATRACTSYPTASWATPRRASTPVVLVESDILASMCGVTPYM